MILTEKHFNLLCNYFGVLAPSRVLYAFFQKLVIPQYSIISNNYQAHINNILLPKSTNEFIKDLDYLLKYFTPVSLDTIITSCKNNISLSKNSFHLTIDGSLKEGYDVILPILKNKGIPATFFVSPGLIDNKNLMHRHKASLIIEEINRNKNKKDKVTKFIKRKMGIRREPKKFILTLKYPHTRILNEIANLTETDFETYLKQHQPYLTSSQISTIKNNGFSIGANSLDLPEYFMISEEEQLKQTINSISLVTNEYKLNYKVFAFPFSDYGVSKSFFDKLYNSSDTLCDLSFGNTRVKENIHPNHLNRISINAFPGSSSIKGQYISYFFKRLITSNPY